MLVREPYIMDSVTHITVTASLSLTHWVPVGLINSHLSVSKLHDYKQNNYILQNPIGCVNHHMHLLKWKMSVGSSVSQRLWYDPAVCAVRLGYLVSH